MSRKKSAERTVALCYIRQSKTRDETDTNSPERQRANIAEVCERNGWTPEWYQDAEGHKSGRYVHNRPGWLQLKKRLGDPDVIALVANDLSRLHRKGWRVGDLLDQMNELDIHLVLAAPGREVDTTTPQGRMFLQFGAIIDEYYATDIGQRAKDNIAYRKKRGKSIGQPPFGSERNADGYLQPSSEGAWLLPDGTHLRGEPTEDPPQPGAIWKGYYEAAGYILSIYAEGGNGAETIAYRMNEEGWAFRTRKGEPRRMKRGDIRRVIANWPEYGGLVFDKKAKDRPAYEDYDVDKIPLRQDRAIFPLDLLRQVATVRQERSIKPKDKGVRRETFPYALSSISFCAHCDTIAAEQDDASLRSAFGGYTTAKRVRRYRHQRGVTCGCTNRSVPAEVYEADFLRLLKLLTIDEEHVDLLTSLAIEADAEVGLSDDSEDFETKKTEAIALARRRIEASIHLFRRGMLDVDEFERDIERNEREIAHWESRTTETQKIAMELAMCMEAVNRIATLWEHGDPEDRQGLVRTLFTSITYDLDARRIVDFELKPWVDRFVILRSELYKDDDDAVLDDTEGEDTDMPHTGFEDTLRYNSEWLVHAAVVFIDEIYRGIVKPLRALSNTPKVKRSAEILRRYSEGEPASKLAEEYGISETHIYQIIKDQL